jgi:hypothetical protein
MGDCEADASKNGADFCVTLCVTRMDKNGVNGKVDFLLLVRPNLLRT